MPMNRHPAHGFTLVELAIVLMIAALLAGGLIVTLSSQMLLRDNRETDQTLAAAMEALIGYAATHTSPTTGNPYLPCPDRTGDGKENRTAGECDTEVGFFPWADLGVGQKDAWNNRLRYRVREEYANSNTGFTLTLLTGVPRVCPSVVDCSGTSPAPIATNLAAVIISHGQNGYGATSVSGVAMAAPTSADELENADNDGSYVSRTPSPQGSNEFDDRVVWLSPYILFSRMIAAGRLP